MNKQEFKKLYGQARAITRAAAIHDINNSLFSGETRKVMSQAAWGYVRAMPSAVYYAVTASRMKEAYDIKRCKWAIKYNSTAFPFFHRRVKV